MNYLHYLEKADLFGVNFKTRIEKKSTSQRSIIGGVVTLLLYSISLCYFLYILIQWQTGKLLPNTSLLTQVMNQSKFQNQSLFEFAFWRYDANLVDPLDPNNLILMPLAFYLQNGHPGPAINLLSQGKMGKSVYNDSRLITFDNITLIQNANFDPSSDPIMEFFIVLAECQQLLLDVGQKCASQSDVDNFFNSGPTHISFWLKLYQYNPFTYQTEQVNKQLYFAIESDRNLNGQLILTPQNITKDEGYLFESISYQQLLGSSEVLLQTTQKSLWKSMTSVNSYLSIFLRVNPIGQSLQVTYIKLGEVLAQVGSISSTLLILGQLVILYNEYLLDERLIRDIIAIQYPNHNYEKKHLEKDIFCETIGKKKVSAKQDDAIYKFHRKVAEEKLQITQIIKDIYNLEQCFKIKKKKKAYEIHTPLLYSNSDDMLAQHIPLQRSQSV